MRLGPTCDAWVFAGDSLQLTRVTTVAHSAGQEARFMARALRALARDDLGYALVSDAEGGELDKLAVTFVTARRR